MAALDPEVVVPLLSELQDSLMVLAPRGWVRAELQLASTPEGLRLTSLQSKGEGARAPLPKPQLNIDPQHEAMRFSEGLTELAAVLLELDKRFEGGRVVVERGPDFVEWQLLRPDGKSPLWLHRLDAEALKPLLFTEPLFDALAGTEQAFALLQERLEARVGVTRGHHFDPLANMLTLEREVGGPATVSAVPLGAWDLGAYSFAWAWAGEGPRSDRLEQVRRICAPQARPEGLSALWREHFHCDEGFAWALATHLCVAVGGRGLFRAWEPTPRQAIFYALLEDPPPVA